MDSTSFPLHFGADEQFAAVRDFMIGSGYTAENICERLGVDRLALFEGLQPRTEAWATKDTLNVLISLFALGEVVTCSDSEVIPEGVMRDLLALGIVAENSASGLYAPVAIGPVEGLLFVSDRWSSPDGSQFEIADDSVYPAITPNTLKFLDTVPQTPCEALLDVGTGTGVGALLRAVHYAKQSWAVDITERSAKFTEFNCRLNGIANVTVGEGDLYGPAGDRTFDRIIAHPPYVPVLTRHWTFHDGGDDGELLTRRLIEGLPRYLRRGGIFHCYAMGSDREVPFEERIREWLGKAQTEFDVQVVVKNQMEPMHFAMQTVLKHPGSEADLARWKQLFEKYQVRRLVFGTMTIQRFAEKRKPFTARRRGEVRSTRAEAEWLLGVEGALARPTVANDVLGMRPKLATDVELVVRHRTESGEFAPSQYELKTDYPFVSDADIPGWAGVFLARCKGESTTQELLDELKTEGYLQKQVPPHDFAMLIATFIRRGFVEVSEMPLPKG
jgi:SAM-dependent methyltransferase